MRRYTPSIIIIALVALAALAGQLTYTTAQVEAGVAIALGDVATPYITFTNGWSISCTSTSLVFVAP
jgi:hypothetical protein